MEARVAFRPLTPPPVLAIRQAIDGAESVMLQLPQVEIPIRHDFADGLYGREILIPAGTCLTGKVHRHADLNFVLYGEIEVLTERGDFKRVTGPCWFPGKAGAKQIGRAITDTLWITVHATCNRDLETLEDEILVPSPWSPHNFATGKLKAHLDYECVVAELGMTEEQVQAQVTCEEDRVDVDLQGLEVRPSGIHGLGVFTLCPRSAGEVLGPARLGILRTQLGRFTNHDPCPNAEMAEAPEGICLRTLREIPPGAEITVNYRQSIAVARRLA